MKSALSRRHFLGSLGAATTLPLFGQPSLGAGGKLIITSYGGRYEKFWREVLLPPFQQKSGVEPVVDVALGVNWATNLRASGPEKPAYSFVMMNELVGAILRNEGFFEPWPASNIPNLANVHPKARNAGDNGVTGMVSPIGIAYRKDLVKKPPASWRDLWENSEFKGKLGMFALQNTAGFMFLMMISKVYGNSPLDFDAGFKMIEQLKPFPQGDLAGALAVLLTRSEIIACPLDLGETVSLQKKGVNVGFVAPPEGVFMFDQTFSLLKNGPNKDAACAFLDYFLSEDVQIKLAQEFSAVPVNTKVKLPPELAKELPLTVADLDKIVTFDWASANKLRDQVTERWNRSMR